MYKVKTLNKISDIGLKEFTDNYSFTEELNEADAVLVRSADMKSLDFGGNLLAVARAGAGVNNIPLDKCAEQGIVVFNTPGANANGVKELVICGMLLAARDVVGGIEWTRSIKDSDTISKDVEKGKKNFAGGEIKGKKLGVIGLGAIGAEVANAAASLGLEVFGYDPYISVNAAWRLSRKIKPITDINEIYKECDYISLHIPLTEDNRGMIGKNSIPQMKDGVVVLNFARDLLVDDEEMEKALESGKVARYVTDFPNTKSAKMEKAIVIPHLGASTQESEDNCAVMAANELVDYLENGNIKNSVNFPSCDMGICQVEGRVSLLHQNIPNMIGQITSAFAKNGYNISDLTNKSKGTKAYTLIDIETKASESLINELNAIEGILKVRIIK